MIFMCNVQCVYIYTEESSCNTMPCSRARSLSFCAQWALLTTS